MPCREKLRAKKPWRVQPLVSVACLLSAFARRERGVRSLAERPAPGDGAPTRVGSPPPHGTPTGLAALGRAVGRRLSRGCGVAVFSSRGTRPGGEMDSRRAALALKPSRPQLRLDRLHWECRCCVRPGVPLMESSTNCVRLSGPLASDPSSRRSSLGRTQPCSAFAYFTHSPPPRRRLHRRRA